MSDKPSDEAQRKAAEIMLKPRGAHEAKLMIATALDAHASEARLCDECDKPLTVVRHCTTDDCCANCGEACRWIEDGFRNGVRFAISVANNSDPRLRKYEEHPGLDELRAVVMNASEARRLERLETSKEAFWIAENIETALGFLRQNDDVLSDAARANLGVAAQITRGLRTPAPTTPDTCPHTNKPCTEHCLETTAGGCMLPPSPTTPEGSETGGGDS